MQRSRVSRHSRPSLRARWPRFWRGSMKPRELTFLVVEDQPFQRNLLVQMLKGLHAKAVFSAEDGRMGLDIIEGAESPLDVVISDLDMPNMDGMEFIRHIGEVASGTSLIIASAMERDLL